MEKEQIKKIIMGHESRMNYSRQPEIGLILIDILACLLRMEQEDINKKNIRKADNEK